MKSTLLALLILALSAFSENSEASNRDKWAKALNGEIEVKIGDGSRCDIITEKYAIEVEWASKRKDSVGQSLWYSFQSKKEAAITSNHSFKSNSNKKKMIIFFLA